jgi:hypothetical protein
VEATQILKKISAERADLFAKYFPIWGPKESGEIKKEVAAERGFDSQCYFSIGWNWNMRHESASLKDVANLMRSTFGEDRILVLFNGETPY